MLIPDLRLVVYRYAFGTDADLSLFEKDITLCANAQRAIPPMFLHPHLPTMTRGYRFDFQRTYNPFRRPLPYSPTWKLNTGGQYLWSYCCSHLSKLVDPCVAFKMRTYRFCIQRWTTQLKRDGIYGWNQYYTKVLSRLRLEYFRDHTRINNEFLGHFFENLEEASVIPL